MHKVIIDEEASPYYLLPEQIQPPFDDLLTQMQTMHPLISAGTATAADREQLSQAIERAERALEGANGIVLNPAAIQGNGAIYNLSGQRVSRMQKGIYIINGKKVLH